MKIKEQLQTIQQKSLTRTRLGKSKKWDRGVFRGPVVEVKIEEEAALVRGSFRARQLEERVLKKSKSTGEVKIPKKVPKLAQRFVAVKSKATNR